MRVGLQKVFVRTLKDVQIVVQGEFQRKSAEMSYSESIGLNQVGTGKKIRVGLQKTFVRGLEDLHIVFKKKLMKIKIKLSIPEAGVGAVEPRLKI